MLVSDFDFSLPKQLIAQHPHKNRRDSRLLVAKKNQISDSKFSDFLDFIKPNDVIVRNNTKVIKARIFANKPTGGKIEILLETIINPQQFLTLVKSNRTVNVGQSIIINDEFELKVIDKKDQFFKLKLLGQYEVNDLLDKHGHVPLPPYINRQDTNFDQQRYQTIYASVAGAVAAPTAGLHFDELMLQKIADKNIKMLELTLHVGSGTFQPVRALDTGNHKMHHEWMQINQATCSQINLAKKMVVELWQLALQH